MIVRLIPETSPGLELLGQLILTLSIYEVGNA